MAQSNCLPDYFFKQVTADIAVYTHKVITTPQQDIIAAGSILKINGEFLDATDGWVTKLSPRGTVLWSKRYFLPGYNSGGFLTIQNATDSTYLVTARYGKYKKRFDGSLEELDAAFFLLHMDKFGNLLWVKRINQYNTGTRLSSITRLQDHSFLLAGNIFQGTNSRILLLNTDINGNVNWYKIFFVDSLYTGSPVVKQLSNGQVLLTGITMKFGPSFSYTTDQGYYFIKVNPGAGAVLHSSAIFINRDPNATVGGFDNIRNIIELPGDTIMLATSFSGLTQFGTVPGVKEGVMMKTGLNGQLYNADGYYNTQPGCRLMDIRYENGRYRMLLDDGYKTLYAEATRGGDIIDQKAYGNAYSLLQGYGFVDGVPANRSLFTGRGQYPFIGLMKTEDAGTMPCTETNSQLVKETVTSSFSTGALQLINVNHAIPFLFEDMGVPISWSAIPSALTVHCEITCCDNIPSDTTYTELCNATSYRLPDQSIVKESGLYYTNVKNANDCDSIAFYDVRFQHKPVINLGDDTCFKENQPILLRADSGYSNYTWNGVATTQHIFTATVPGTYTLDITNQCGTGTGSIIIYEDCDFPVYMPSGFTPNNDGLNDLFRYPPQNKNRFVSLEIYNRYGQRVFYTKDAGKGWDGSIRNMDQPLGVYVYLLRVTTLNGRPVLKKGTFTLIR